MLVEVTQSTLMKQQIVVCRYLALHLLHVVCTKDVSDHVASLWKSS